MRVSSQPAAGLGERMRDPRARDLPDTNNLTQTKKKSKDYKSHLIGKLKMHGKLSKFLESAEEISFFHNPKDVAYLISLVEHEDYENLSASLIHALLVLIEKQKHCVFGSSKRATPATGADNTKRTLISFLNEQESPGSSLDRRIGTQSSHASVAAGLAGQKHVGPTKPTDDSSRSLTGGQLNSKGMLIQDQSSLSGKNSQNRESNPYQLFEPNNQVRRPSPAGLPLGKVAESAKAGQQPDLAKSNRSKEDPNQDMSNQPTFRSNKAGSQHTQRQTEGDLYNYSDDEQPEPKTEKKWAALDLNWKGEELYTRQGASQPQDQQVLGRLKTETSNEESQKPEWAEQAGMYRQYEDSEEAQQDQGEEEQLEEPDVDNYREEGEQPADLEEETGSPTSGANPGKRQKPNLSLNPPSEDEYNKGYSKSGNYEAQASKKRYFMEGTQSPHSSDIPSYPKPSGGTSEAHLPDELGGDKSPAFGSYRNVYKGGDYGYGNKQSPAGQDSRISPTANRQPHPKLGASPQLSFGGEQHRKDNKGTSNTTPSSQASGLKKDTSFNPGAKRFSKDSGSVDSSKLKDPRTEKDAFTFNDIALGPEMVRKGRNVSLDQKTLSVVSGLRKVESPSSDDNTKSKSKHASQASDDIQTNEIQGVFQIDGEEGSITQKLKQQGNSIRSNSGKRQNISQSRSPNQLTKVSSAHSLKRGSDKEAYNPLQTKDLSDVLKKPVTSIPAVPSLLPQSGTPSNKPLVGKPTMSLSPETKPKVKISLLSKSGSADKPTGNNAARLSTNNTENSEQIRFSKDLNRKGLTSSFEASSGFKRSDLLSQAKKFDEPSLGSQSASKLPLFSAPNKQNKSPNSSKPTPLSTERTEVKAVAPVQAFPVSKESKEATNSSIRSKPSVKIASSQLSKQGNLTRAKGTFSDAEQSSNLHSNSVSNLLKDAKLSTKAPSSTDVLKDIKKSVNSSTKPIQTKKASTAAVVVASSEKQSSPSSKFTLQEPSEKMPEAVVVQSQPKMTKDTNTGLISAHSSLERSRQPTDRSKDLKPSQTKAKTPQTKLTPSVANNKISQESSKQNTKVEVKPQPMLSELREQMNSNFFTGLNSPTDNLSKSKAGELGLNDMSKIPNSKNESFEKDEDLSGLHRILKETWADPHIPAKAQDASLDFTNSRDFKGKSSGLSKDRTARVMNTAPSAKLQFSQVSAKGTKQPAKQPSQPGKTLTSNPAQSIQEAISVTKPTITNSTARGERDKAPAQLQPRRISTIFNKASTKLSKPSKRAGISSSLSGVRNSARNLSQQSQASSQFHSGVMGSPDGLKEILEKNRSTSQSAKGLTNQVSNSAKTGSKNISGRPQTKLGPKTGVSSVLSRDKPSLVSQIPKLNRPSSVQFSPRPASVTSSVGQRRLSGQKASRPSTSVQKLVFTPRSGSQSLQKSQPLFAAKKPSSLAPNQRKAIPSIPKLESKSKLNPPTKSVQSSLRGLRLDAARPGVSQRKDSLVTKSSRYTSVSKPETAPLFSNKKLTVPKLGLKPSILAPSNKRSSDLPITRVSSVPQLPKPAAAKAKITPRGVLNSASKPPLIPPRQKGSIREALSDRPISQANSAASYPRIGLKTSTQKKEGLLFPSKLSQPGKGFNTTQKLTGLPKVVSVKSMLAPSPIDNLSSVSEVTGRDHKGSQQGSNRASRPPIQTKDKPVQSSLFSSQPNRPSSLPRPKSSLLFGSSASKNLERIKEDVLSSSSRAATEIHPEQRQTPSKYANKPLYPKSKAPGAASKGIKVVSASQLLKDLRKSASPAKGGLANEPKVAPNSASKAKLPSTEPQTGVKGLLSATKKEGALPANKRISSSKAKYPSATVVLNESRSISRSDHSGNQKKGADSARIVIDTVQDMLFKNKKTNKAKGFDRIQPASSVAGALRKSAMQSSASDLRVKTEPSKVPEVKPASKLTLKDQPKPLPSTQLSVKQLTNPTRTSGAARIKPRADTVTRSVDSTGSDQRGSSLNSRQKSKGYEVPNKILEEVYEDDDSPKKFAVNPSAPSRSLKQNRATTSSLEYKKRTKFDPTMHILKNLDSGKKIGLSPIQPIKGHATSLTDGKLFDSQEGPSPQVDKFAGSQDHIDEADHEKAEPSEKLNLSRGEYSSMLHKLKAFSHLGGLQPYQTAQTSRDASVEIIRAMDSLVNKSLVPHDISTEERLFHVPKEKPTPDRRFETLRAGRIPGMDDSLSGAKTPILSNKRGDPNMSKSFGSGRKDHRFSLEDYSMMTEMCKSPADPIEITAHFTGSIGGRTQPWSRRHFPERDQSRSSQTKFE